MLLRDFQDIVSLDLNKGCDLTITGEWWLQEVKSDETEQLQQNEETMPTLKNF